MPIYFLLSAFAHSKVVPLPAKQSNTILFLLDDCSIIGFIISGFF